MPTCLVTSDVLDSIGNTPLLRLRHASDETGCEIYAKAEYLNPGGSIMGVGRALREHGSKARIVAVEPDESAVLSGGTRGRHGIQWLADGFNPDLVNTSELDQVIRIKTDDAIRTALAMSHEEGLLVGISSGANVIAAMQLAEEIGPGTVIVSVLPDRGERYLSLHSQCFPSSELRLR